MLNIKSTVGWRNGSKTVNDGRWSYHETSLHRSNKRHLQDSRSLCHRHPRSDPQARRCATLDSHSRCMCGCSHSFAIGILALQGNFESFRVWIF